MTAHYGVLVVGGGIAGLAHAWSAAQRGHSVLLTERSQIAQGASVRNFGMLWPIAQPNGELHDVALRSCAHWLELKSRGVVEVDECGSIFVAYHSDELAVLNEFCQAKYHPAEMLSPEAVRQRARIVNPSGLLGGMWSPSEMRVDPRTASARIAHWLATDMGVTLCFDTLIVDVRDGRAVASDGRCWTADRIIICSGSDLQTLFPLTLVKSQLRKCKLQMLCCRQSFGQFGMPHLASGLALRHYNSFSKCPSLAAVRARVAAEAPELDRYGIHVMASAFPNGDILLGDSHEYDGEITPFNNSEIDELMLRELRKILQLDDWAISQSWHGIYAKHNQMPVVEGEPAPNVHLFVGLGGGGMTMAFGLAERSWSRWTGKGS